MLRFNSTSMSTNQTSFKSQPNEKTIEENNFVVVAAIDFGTSNSGYAFSFKQEYRNDRLKIYTHKWQSRSKSGTSYKAPTSILFDTDMKFHSFGYEAEEHYASLVESKQKNYDGWYFFKRFKMKLYDQMRLKRDFILEDESGKGMEGQRVFGTCIDYLKKHLITTLKNRSREVNESDIFWVITVPAIWNDTAKQFMRQAAHWAGIKDNQLSLALEPEAAALYCKTLPEENFAGTDDEVLINAFKPGGKYMVLDLGGGTVDTAVHGVQEDGSLIEIHKSCGGPWGGSKVDENFFQHIKQQFGENCVPELMKTCPSDWLKLSEEFESLKMKISYLAEKNLKLPIPQKLIIVSQMKVKDLTSYDTKLKIDDQKTKMFFAPVSEAIVQHVGNILRKIQDLELILMVGAFSESEYMSEIMKEKFANIKVIVPLEAGMSVLKGAVLFGCHEVFQTRLDIESLNHVPSYKICRVTARICRYTYGIRCIEDFEEGKHLDEYKDTVDDKIKCKNIFLRLVAAGEKIKINEVRAKDLNSTHVNPDRKFISMTIPVYTTDKSSVMYTTDPSCKLLGEIVIKPPDEGWQEEVNYKLLAYFGRTEFNVKVEDSTGRESVSATYDFLD